MPIRRSATRAGKSTRKRRSLSMRETNISRRLNEPIDMKTTLTKRYRIRFVGTPNNGATPNNATWGELIDLISVGTSANAALQQARTINAVRLREIEMWCPGSATTVTSCGVELNANTGGFQGNSIKKTDTTLGTAIPCHVHLKVPKSTAESNWVVSGTSGSAAPNAVAAFSFWSTAAASTTVLDVVMDVAFIDQNGSNVFSTYAGQAGVTNYPSAPAVGQVFYTSLGRGNASAVMTPTALLTY